MKKSTLTIAIVISGLFVASVLITSCGSKKEQGTEEHEHAEGDTTRDHHDEMEMDSAKCTTWTLHRWPMLAPCIRK